MPDQDCRANKTHTGLVQLQALKGIVIPLSNSFRELNRGLIYRWEGKVSKEPQGLAVFIPMFPLPNRAITGIYASTPGLCKHDNVCKKRTLLSDDI